MSRRPNWGIFGRISVLTFMLLLISVGIVVYAVQSLHSLDRDFQAVQEQNVQKSLLLGDLRQSVGYNMLKVADHLATNDPNTTSAIEKDISDRDRKITDLRQTLNTEGFSDAKLSLFVDYTYQYDSYLKIRGQILELSRKGEKEQAQELNMGAAPHRNQALMDLAKLMTLNIDEANTDLNAAVQKHAAMEKHFYYQIGIGFVLALVLSLYLARTMSKPLKVLEESARKVAVGNFAVDWGVKGGKEIDSLAISLETMMKSLQRMTEAYLNHAADSVLVVNTEGTIQMLNPATEAMFGFKASELKGTSIQCLIPEPYRQKHESYIKHFDTIRKSKLDNNRIEVSGLRYDGRVFPIEVTISQFHNGEEFLFILILRDISKRKEDAKELSLWAKVFETSLFGMVITDTQGNIQAVNRVFTEMTGLSAETIIGRSYGLLASREQDENLFLLIQERLQAEGYWEGELWNRRKNRERFPLWLSASVVRDKTGKITNFIGIFRDITLDVQLRQEITAASKMQKNALRPDLDNRWLEMRTIYQPYQYVSGDCYDYRWDEENLVLNGILLDVMGHGLATALQLSAIRLLFQQATLSEAAVGKRLQWMNRESSPICNENSFAAAIYFSINVHEGMLAMASAGMTQILLLSEGQLGVITAPGLFLGIDKNQTYEELAFAFKPGDAVIFLSDGFYDLLTLDDKKEMTNFDQAMDRLGQIAQERARYDDITAFGILLKRQ